MTLLHFFGFFFVVAVVLPTVLSMVAEELQCRARRRKP